MSTAPSPVLLERAIALRQECEVKAFDSLGRYKFAMFGYWASHWVAINRLIGDDRPNPFRDLVHEARSHTPTLSNVPAAYREV